MASSCTMTEILEHLSLGAVLLQTSQVPRTKANKKFRIRTVPVSILLRPSLKSPLHFYIIQCFRQTPGRPHCFHSQIYLSLKLLICEGPQGCTCGEVESRPNEQMLTGGPRAAS
jgi:hypothetical protein